MKCLFLFIALCGVCSAIVCCRNINIQTENSATNPEAFKTLDTRLPFSGHWISEDYYNSIKKDRSPRLAQEGSQYIHIPERTLQPAMMIYNFHEAGTTLTFIKNGHSYEAWEVLNDSLTQRLSSVKIMSDERMTLGNTRFRKIALKSRKAHPGILEELLFKGSYRDATGNKIVFHNDGRITGMKEVTYYEPMLDYFDAGRQIDQVGLLINGDELKWFGFRFIGDTINLYTMNCSAFDHTENRCVEVDYGEMIYKLWREK